MLAEDKTMAAASVTENLLSPARIEVAFSPIKITEHIDLHHVATRKQTDI